MTRQLDPPSRSHTTSLLGALLDDFAMVHRDFPEAHPRRIILELLEEALRRDRHFVERHPTTLFQCLWNACAWHDETAPEGAPARTTQPHGVKELVEMWRRTIVAREQRRWVRSLVPPRDALGRGRATTLRGHSASVQALAFNHRGTRLATTAFEQVALGIHPLATIAPTFPILNKPTDQPSGSVIVWSLHDGQQLWTAVVPNEGLACLRFSLDDRYLYGGTKTGRLLQWDTATGELVRTATFGKTMLLSIQLAPGRDEIAVAAADSTCYLVDRATLTERWRIRGTGSAFTGCAYSPDERTLAVSFGSNMLGGNITHGVHVYDLQTRHVVGRLAHPMGVTDVAFVAPERLVTAAHDGMIRLWNWQTATEVACLSQHGRAAWNIGAATNYVVSGASDGSVHVYHLANNQLWQRFLDTTSEVLCTSITDDGQQIAWGTSTGNVVVRSTHQRYYDESPTNQRLAGQVRCQRWVADGSAWLVGTSAGMLASFAPSSGAMRAQTLLGRIEEIQPGHTATSVITRRHRDLEVWDASSLHVADVIHPFGAAEDYSSEITCFAVDIERDELAFGVLNGCVCLYDLAGSADLQCFDPCNGVKRPLGFDPQFGRIVYTTEVTCVLHAGQVIYVGYADGTLRAWHRAAKQPHHGTVRIHQQRINHLVLADQLISIDESGELVLWSVTLSETTIDLVPEPWGRYLGGKVQASAVDQSGTGLWLQGADGHYAHVELGERHGMRWAGTVDLAPCTKSAPILGVAREHEFILVHSPSAQPIGWFPASIDHPQAAPNDWIWAGIEHNGSYAYLFALEGDIPARKPTSRTDNVPVLLASTLSVTAATIAAPRHPIHIGHPSGWTHVELSSEVIAHGGFLALARGSAHFDCSFGPLDSLTPSDPYLRQQMLLDYARRLPNAQSKPYIRWAARDPLLNFACAEIATTNGWYGLISIVTGRDEFVLRYTTTMNSRDELFQLLESLTSDEQNLTPPVLKLIPQPIVDRWMILTLILGFVLFIYWLIKLLNHRDTNGIGKLLNGS